MEGKITSCINKKLLKNTEVETWQENIAEVVSEAHIANVLQLYFALKLKESYEK